MRIIDCIMYLKSKGYTYICDNIFINKEGKKIQFEDFYKLEKFCLTMKKKDAILLHVNNTT